MTSPYLERAAARCARMDLLWSEAFFGAWELCRNWDEAEEFADKVKRERQQLAQANGEAA